MNEIYINLKEQDECFIWNWLRQKHKRDLLSVYDLAGYIEDLVGEIQHLEEELQDLKNDIRDNYKPISNQEMYE